MGHDQGLLDLGYPREEGRCYGRHQDRSQENQGSLTSGLVLLTLGIVLVVARRFLV